jgi:methionyl-tRNA synthetase
MTSDAAPSKDFYLTTPIYYVNDAPHIGHAYTTTAGDVLTRWHRQRGEGVWFLTGTDEHGTKVERTALANNVTPLEWVDKLVEEAWRPKLLTIDAANDDFIRTTEERHAVGVQRFWEVVKENGAVYPSLYEGPYCVPCEEFKFPADLEIPESGEYAGKQVCLIHHRPVEMLTEQNWFFRLSDYQQRLLDHYATNPEAVQPQSAYNEVVSFIKGGLSDISMSRSAVSWGIPVPWDTEQVVYVWFDALLNYATAVGFGADPESPEGKLFARTWPPDVHLVGKDILRFHAVYWPAMLMAAGLELPKTVFAHGWLLVGGEKMSKTKLTGISPNQIVDVVGSDAFRYYFLSAIRFGQDGSFSWEDLVARYTSELANGLGNLVSRTTAMVGRYFDGVLPAPGELTESDQALINVLTQSSIEADEAIVRLDFTTGIAAIRSIVEAANGYITEQQPWVLAKDDAQRERLGTVLYVVADVLRAVAVLYNPVMPKAATSMWQQLGAEDLGFIADQPIADVGRFGQLAPGAVLTKGEGLFPRLPEEETA